MHTVVALLFSVILLSGLSEVSSFSMGAPDSACQGKFRPPLHYDYHNIV